MTPWSLDHSVVSAQFRSGRHAPLGLAIFTHVSPLHMATRRAGHGATRRAGHAATRRAGHAATRRAGHAATRRAGHAATRRAGHAATRRAGHAATRRAGHAATRRAGHTEGRPRGGQATGQMLQAAHSSLFVKGRSVQSFFMYVKIHSILVTLIISFQ